MTTIDQSVLDMWEKYLKSIGEDVETTDKNYTSWHFELTKNGANELAELVLSGQKKATSSLYWAFEYDQEPIPQKGDYSIITDWDGIAKCIIQTMSLEILPYKDVTEEMARKEGEGDLSLAYWRKVHKIFYEKECLKIGKTFHEEIPVAFEEFEVVFK